MSMTREEFESYVEKITYSTRYYDDTYEYRHVVLPKEMLPLVPKPHLLTENEWRGIGVQQSKGWVHYMWHEPEPHVLLFRRPISIVPKHPPTYS